MTSVSACATRARSTPTKPIAPRGYRASRANFTRSLLVATTDADDLVDRVQVGTGRRFHDVGGHPTSGYAGAFGIELDDDIAERIDAAGRRVDVEVGHVAVGIGRLADGAA